ncbi:uncharacterized protein LOC110429545 [Sorghum bicolor]|uniref:uncharacterized protein LOC110429545 n=1 Tax=Sorghum bicolor TaxID=4558 RepID=UPI000B425191|nr:uncharacterized protein LOC110429545 [Sorghum bicolor]|eukprot:XP_021301281.1 uncharacterized protein LOC110429545 [Sorghum bicolor]
MAHKGKASSSISYNPSDPPEAYTNASVHSRLSEYTEAGRSVHGPEWDPTRNELDTELVMRLGGGKKHGRYWIADSVIDTASTPTLFQIRAASTDGSVPIRQRTTPSQQRVEALEARVLAADQRSLDIEAQLAAERAERAAQDRWVAQLI